MSDKVEEYKLTQVLNSITWRKSAHIYNVYVDKDGNPVVVVGGQQNMCFIKCRYGDNAMKTTDSLEIGIRIDSNYNTSAQSILYISVRVPELMFLVVFTREIVIQRANCLNEYMDPGYLVVRSDLSVEHKTSEDILQGMNGIELGASMFLQPVAAQRNLCLFTTHFQGLC